MTKTQYVVSCDNCQQDQPGGPYPTQVASLHAARQSGWKAPYRSSGRLNTRGNDLCQECQ